MFGEVDNVLSETSVYCLNNGGVPLFGAIYTVYNSIYKYIHCICVFADVNDVQCNSFVSFLDQHHRNIGWIHLPRLVEQHPKREKKPS